MTDVKRFNPLDPAIAGREVILARDYDSQTSLLVLADSLCTEWQNQYASMKAERNALDDELAKLRGEVSTELRMQILHMRREVVRQDRSPLLVRQKMVERLTTLLNRWVKGPETSSSSSPEAIDTAA